MYPDVLPSLGLLQNKVPGTNITNYYLPEAEAHTTDLFFQVSLCPGAYDSGWDHS